MEQFRFRKRARVWTLAACVVLAPAFAAAQDSSWRLASKDGESWVKFGFLAQVRGEAAQSDAYEGTSSDLYFRRLRLMLGASLGGKWNLFTETDSPLLGKGLPDGSKVSGDVFIQDFVLNYKHSTAFQFDAGLILAPFSHNGTQSAVTLMPLDYGVFSFVESLATQSRVGRDYGIQLWGHVLNKKLEYRGCLFQGAPGENSTNNLRTTTRLVYYFFEPDLGRFYQGTSLGKKQILSIGGSYDTQEDYAAYDVDVYWDQPLGKGDKDGNRDGLTLQGTVSHFDGEDFIDVPEQDVIYFEGGYWIHSLRLQPYVVYGTRDFAAEGTPDETHAEVGIGWYMKRFNRVLKLSFQSFDRDGGDDIERVIVQLQAFQF
jgi:hypothetical protein